MIFAYDTEVGLVSAAALVNTAARDSELLADPAALDVFLTEQQWSGARTGSTDELAEVTTLRPVLRRFWELDEVGAVALVNRLLRDAKLYEIGAGTSEIRRMLIGREMMGAMSAA